MDKKERVITEGSAEEGYREAVSYITLPLKISNREPLIDVSAGDMRES